MNSKLQKKLKAMEEEMIRTSIESSFIFEELRAMQEKRKREYYATRTGAVYKKHIEVFGVKPVTLAWYEPEGERYRKAIQRALREGKPLNEYEALSPEYRKAFDEGKLTLD